MGTGQWKLDPKHPLPLENVIQNNLLLSHSKLHNVCISFVNPIKILTVTSHTFKDRISCKIFASAHLKNSFTNRTFWSGKNCFTFRFYLTFQRLLSYFCIALWKRGLRYTSTSDRLPARLPALHTLTSTISAPISWQIMPADWQDKYSIYVCCHN